MQRLADITEHDKTGRRIAGMLLAAFLVAAGPYHRAYCQSQTDGYAMMIQASPVDGGRVTPDSGVHRFGSDETVTLKAVAQPGYRFVYWLGDVNNPATSETTIEINGPKIVVAMFQRSEFDLPVEVRRLVSGSGSGGGTGVPNPIGMGGGISPARGAFPRPEFPPLDRNDFPVPGDGDNDGSFPIPGPNDQEPIPEPATVVLMSLGALAIMRNRRGSLVPGIAS